MGKAFHKLWDCILENAAGIGIVLGFLLWRNHLHRTYFALEYQDTIRPAAGILLFAFAFNFVTNLGWTFFRIFRMILQTNRFTNQLCGGRVVSRLIRKVLQLIVGIWLAACIMDSWKRLTKASECLPARSCSRFPFSLILEGKYLICPKLSNMGELSFYPELTCEMIFDLMPFFLVLVLTVTLTLVISILQKRTQQGFIEWKNIQKRSNALHIMKEQ